MLYFYTEVENDHLSDVLNAIRYMKNLEFKPAFYDELIKASQPVYKTIEGKIGSGVVNGLVNALKTGK